MPKSKLKDPKKKSKRVLKDPNSYTNRTRLEQVLNKSFGLTALVDEINGNTIKLVFSSYTDVNPFNLTLAMTELGTDSGKITSELEHDPYGCCCSNTPSSHLEVVISEITIWPDGIIHV